ncbi:mRNA export factor GLE1 [Ischnura elegans]|uniref:mRNA export factor GLE1 n=1 Tax=Ischnura elegans TaxID=197161 RepID=UPI001ED883FD|nr:mRNA export factor GLE1 [Ischnura elegans]
MGSSTEEKAENNVADSENKPVGMQSNASYQIEFKDLDHDNQEISFSKFCEILNDMEFNETCERKDEVERLSVVEHITQVSEENVGKDSISLANDGESGVTFDSTGDSEIHESILKQEENIEEQFAFPSEEFIGIKPQNFNNQVFEFDDETQDEEDIFHQNQSAFSSIKDESELSVSQKSQYKHLMHHKWSNSRLPAYNGLNSEYGLTAEMLEERKRKAEIIRQKLWEKKKKEEEIKEQKKKENDESFRDWLRKKEAERKKSADEKKNYEFVYDHEEAENAFQAWLKRKAKELRQQKKQNEAQKEYEMQLALRRTFEESQREFKRWLRTKVKKSSPPGKHKSCTFRSMRKSHKRYVVERDVHMKNTCKIYLGR